MRKTKHCPKCKFDKNNSEFGKGSSGKLNSWCKECKKRLSEKTDAESKKKEADRIFGYTLKTKYGISLADYNNLLEAQNGECAICGKNNPFSKHGRFAVDHCHNTGLVRGLLCHNCNAGLGQFKDNIDLLQNAIIYLEYNEGKSIRGLF